MSARDPRINVSETVAHRFTVARCTAFTLTGGYLIGRTNSGGHGTYAVPFIEVASKFAETANKQECEAIINLLTARLSVLE